jgi:hypothetical protein
VSERLPEFCDRCTGAGNSPASSSVDEPMDKLERVAPTPEDDSVAMIRLDLARWDLEKYEHEDRRHDKIVCFVAGNSLGFAFACVLIAWLFL